MNKKVELRVFEAYDDDMGRMTARIDHDSMNSIGVSIGDIIEIEGTRKTAAKCMPLYPFDDRKTMIRVDGLIRNNAGIEINAIVTIRKAISKKANQITIRPVESFPSIDSEYMTNMLESVLVMKGDHILIPYFGGRADVEVIGLTPDGVCIIDPKTIFIIEKNSQ